jgi:lysylphosphatidylglycerol synthetase-like protein (DUF2156 family)
MDSKREFIKVIAMVTMLLDHIGWLFLPSWSFLRIIGRLAMPCYAYLIGCGIQSTHNSRLYFWRLLGLAVISQFGFCRFNHHQFNIIFTFALSVAAITCWRDGKFLKCLFLTVITAIAPVEFGLYGLLSIIILQKVHDRPIITAIVYLIVSIVCGMIYKMSPIQAVAVMAVAVIYFAPAVKWNIPKYIWRLFYPVHWWFFALWRYLCVL